MNHQDHRQYPRKIFRTIVKVLVDKDHIYQAKSIDISQTGLCLIIPGKNLNIGTTCHIFFDLVLLGKVYKIQVVAKVVYSICVSEGFKAGLLFTKIDAVAEAAIQAFTM